VFGVPALELILSKLPATVELALLATAPAVGIGIPLGLVAGLRPDSWLSRSIMTGSILGFSADLLVGLVLIMLFSVQLGWLPSGGRGETVTPLGQRWSLFTVDGLQHLLMPAINLALFKLAADPPDAGADPRSAAAGLCALRPRQGPACRTRGRRARAEEHPDPHRHHHRPGVRLGDRICHRHRVDLRLARALGKLLIDSINLLDRPVIVAYLLVIVTLFITIQSGGGPAVHRRSIHAYAPVRDRVAA
jgi:peptide/nickel transport system permease protein